MQIKVGRLVKQKNWLQAKKYEQKVATSLLKNEKLLQAFSKFKEDVDAFTDIERQLANL